MSVLLSPIRRFEIRVFLIKKIGGLASLKYIIGGLVLLSMRMLILSTLLNILENNTFIFVRERFNFVVGENRIKFLFLHKLFINLMLFICFQ